MLSAILSSEQHPSSHLHLLDSIPTTVGPSAAFALHSFVSENSSYLFDNVDIQSLPSLMSPNHSNKDFSESLDGREEEDEDEESDGYEIFTCPRISQQSQLRQSDHKPMTPLQVLRPSRRMVQESVFHMPSLQYRQQPSSSYAAYEAPSIGLHDMYPQLQQPQPHEIGCFHSSHIHFQNQQTQGTQFLCPEAQLQRQQEHGPFYSYVQHAPSQPISSVYPTPAITPYGSYEPAITMHRDPSSLQYSFASLEQHEQQQQQQPMDASFQRPTLQNTVPIFDQGVDQLMASHLPEVSSNMESLPLLMSSSAGSLVQSPTMSWTSISRGASPDRAQPTVSSKRPVLRPSKKRSGSTNSRSAGKISRSRTFVSFVGHVGNAGAPSQPLTSGVSAETPIQSSHEIIQDSSSITSSSTTTTVMGVPSKRKRRVRQVKIKVKPTSFACDAPNCRKVFSRAYNLTSHMKTHSEERPFLCGSCPLAFARRHDRERHVRLHTGEKPYSCESCGCGFMRNDALHRHQRICGQSATALMALLQQQQHQHQHQLRLQPQPETQQLTQLEPTTRYEDIFAV